MCIAALAGLPGLLGANFGGILSAVGTGVSVVGTIAGAQAAGAAASYKQKQEAMLAEDALKRGAQAEEAQRRKAAALAGRQRAVLAASNIDIGSGSALQIQTDTAQLSELDAQVIRDNSRREANYHTANSDLAGMEAKSASSAGMLGAFSTVLGGAGTLASKWYKPVPSSGGGGGFSLTSRPSWAGN
jgi:hypothetical protein